MDLLTSFFFFIYLISYHNTTLFTITIIAAITDFVDWHKECCGKELQDKIMNILETTDERGDIVSYTKNLREFRHRGIHCLDYISRAQKATNPELFEKIKKTKKYLLRVIDHLIKENLGYLKGEEGSEPNKPVFLLRIAEKEINLCLPKLPAGGQLTNISPEDQAEIFVSSIVHSKKIILLFKEEIQSEEAAGFKINEIIAIAAMDDKKLINLENIKINDKEFSQSECTKIKLKYTTLLLALGEVLGNLQRYDLLSEIGKLDIKQDGQFTELAKQIPIIREYRNTRTHHGHHNQASFSEILRNINKNYNEIIKELDNLYNEVKNKSKDSENLKDINFDAIKQEELPLRKEPNNIFCLLS
ncbi:hypothetical protein NF27_EF00010 [Candidatus Jidaibacter acanthamoeba]|uniref:RiboL-PSP-HEPN domain-containing protein n=2 Tax=Candidatus Jidaibacter acanthamoebae TaxID=86105 RepID=A0A0C1QYX2_9RICK|nr:hypothetical protein NF27_EF00010 [Candidatus Jidaibacter acanthamoeba]